MNKPKTNVKWYAKGEEFKRQFANIADDILYQKGKEEDFTARVPNKIDKSKEVCRKVIWKT